MSDCLETGKASWHITNTKVNSALYFCGASKLSTGLSGWGQVHMWSHMTDGGLWVWKVRGRKLQFHACLFFNFFPRMRILYFGKNIFRQEDSFPAG